MIIVFSEKNCYSTSEVVEWLNAFGERVVRLNGDENRFWLKYIDIGNNQIIVNSLDYGEINLTQAKSIWYRRNGISSLFFNAFFDLDNLVKEIHDISFGKYLHRSYSGEVNKIKEFIYGLSERTTLSINSYFYSDLNKLQVLYYAKDLGLKIPTSIIANSPQRLSSEKGMVTKAVNDGIYYFGNKKAYYSYTEKYNSKDAHRNFFFSLFQNEISKKFEIRTFYIMGKFYSMAIMSQNNNQTKVDFRKYDDKVPNRTIPYRLPEDIVNKLKLLFSRLNLNSGSVDLIKNEKNEYIFLEINPVGQFGMVAYPCNYPLDKIISEILSHRTK